MTDLSAAVEQYSCTDSFFGAPYLDVDEQRDAPVEHRYVHGGFEGTDTRFALYFPVGGGERFFQFLDGVNQGAGRLIRRYPTGRPYGARWLLCQRSDAGRSRESAAAVVAAPRAGIAVQGKLLKPALRRAVR